MPVSRCQDMVLTFSIEHPLDWKMGQLDLRRSQLTNSSLTSY